MAFQIRIRNLGIRIHGSGLIRKKYLRIRNAALKSFVPSVIIWADVIDVFKIKYLTPSVILMQGCGSAFIMRIQIQPFNC
jgi:hypothetical protein